MPWGDAKGLENVWTIATPVAGVTVTANMALGTASLNCIVGLLNPAGNPKPAYIRRAELILLVSGTAVTNGYVWGVCSATQAAVITSTGVTAAVNGLTYLAVTHGAAGGPVVESFGGAGGTLSVLAGTTAGSVAFYRPFGAPTSTAPATVEYPDDDMVVAPGTFLGLFPGSAGGGTPVVSGSITWSEGA